MVTLVAAIGIVGYVFSTVAFGVGSYLSFVSGTEYQRGEPAQVIIKVHDAWGRPLPQSAINWCNVTILYPDKTIFINNETMSYTPTTGSWYYQFTTPFTQIGVYEAYVECSVNFPSGSRILSASKAFHVSQTLTMLNETASASITIISP